MSGPTDSLSARGKEELARRVHAAASSRLGMADLKRLLAERPDCVSLADASQFNRAPLHSAIAHNQDESLEILLQHGANPNHVMSRIDHLWQPLHYASALGHTRCIVVLLRYGADIFGKDESGFTPLEKASRNRHKACANLLKEEETLHKSRYASNQKKIAAAMQAAAMEGDMATLKELIGQYEGKWKERFPSDGKTLLHRACEAGHVKMAVTLLDDPYKTPGYPCDRPPNKTPLHSACENGHPMVVMWLMRAFPEMLLKTTTDSNSTALHLALANNHSLAAIAFLKEAMKGGREGTLKTILTFSDFEGRIPFQIAVQNRNLRVAMVMFGQKRHVYDEDDSAASALAGAGSEVLLPQLHARRLGGFHPIHDACENGSLDMVRWLCEQGAKVNAVVGNGVQAVTPLQIAVRNGNAELAAQLLDHMAVDDGGKALADAVRSCRPDLVDVLLLQRVEEDISEAHRLTDLHSKGSQLSDAQLTGLAVALRWGAQDLEEIAMDWVYRVSQRYSKPLSDFAKQFVPAPTFRYVSLLELSGNKLISLPSEVFQLPQLRVLECSNNKLTSLPKDIAVDGASSLYKVILPGNQLTEIPVTLLMLANLETLDVSHNAITQLPPEIWYAPALRHFNASHNQLQELPVQTRSKCRRAQHRSARAANDGSASLHPSLTRSMSPVPEGVQSPEGSVLKPVSQHCSAGSSGIGSMERPGSESRSSQSEHSNSDPDPPKSTSTRRRGDRTIGSFTHDLLESSDEEEEDEDGGGDQRTKRSQSLRTLDVNHNELGSLPAELPCLAPELGKLHAGHNKIAEVGFPRSFPPGLRVLDLSYNRVRNVVASHDVAAHSCCRLGRSKAAAAAVTRPGDAPPPATSCSHRKHNSLPRLSTLHLQHNLVCEFNILFPEAEERTFMMVEDPTRKSPASSANSGQVRGGRLSQEEAEELSCPALSHLDLSHNLLSDVPVCLAKLGTSLAVLNIAHNVEIIKLPDKLGLLTELFTLNMDGLHIVDPAPDFLEGKKVSEIITFLKGRLRNAEPYRRLKLMMVGLQERGKTTLLRTLKGGRPLEADVEEQLCRSFWVENTEGAAKVATKSTSKKQNVSTVGVSLGAWQYAKTIGFFGAKKEPITFMTWDFGGQKEYYATHQYFLSKRAVYLLLWRSVEQTDGIKQLHSWLVNIQARAPDAAVIIVGTYLDQLPRAQQRGSYLDNLRKEIIDRYGMYDDRNAPKMGYPRIHAIHFVNAEADDELMKKLRNSIYDVASKLEVGSDAKSRGVHRAHRASILDDKVPSSYLRLGKKIREASDRMRRVGKTPVMAGKEFRDNFLYIEQPDFDAKEELDAAVNFLHDNGVMLHYDDPSLTDYYFLEPQWLCDMLAHVVTVESVHSFIKNGVLPRKHYPQIFKSNSFPSDHIHEYEKLLAKFEVALRINDDELLVPSLLPDKKGSTCIEVDTNKASLYHRYVTLPYVPSGFWARLISRILSDKEICSIKERICRLRFASESPLAEAMEWSYWSTGLQLQSPGSLLLLHVSECGNVSVLPELDDVQMTGNSRFYVDGSSAVVDDGSLKLQLFWKDNCWSRLQCQHSVRVAVLRAQGEDAGTLCRETGHSLASLCALMMSKTIGHIDALVEDWFHGVMMASMKLVPCHKCICEEPDTDDELVRQRCSTLTNDGQLQIAGCLFHWEELVWATRNGTGGGAGVAAGGGGGGDELLSVMCLRHGRQMLSAISPDVVFEDLPPAKIIASQTLRKKNRLGKGAFGAVYRGILKPSEGNGALLDVAIKSLLPDSQEDDLLNSTTGGPETADAAAKKPYKSVEPSQIASAYTNTRKELAVMCALAHPHIIPFYGVCLRPLCFVLQLAQGELSGVLKSYREAGKMLSFSAAWASALQIASGLEYLHNKDIVYCDLKAENVLVFQHPTPLSDEQGTFRPALRSLQPGQSADWYRHDTARQQLATESAAVCGVRVKIADFGISRSTTYDGARGFGGTYGYMAPEIIQYRGRETYTDRVDIFSYAMVLYELITLHGPMSNASEAEIKRGYQHGVRPKLTRKHLQSSIMLRELMHWCWQQLPEDRPSARQVIDSLTDSPHARLLHGFVLTEALPFTACHSRQATTGPAVAVTSPNATPHLSMLAEDTETETGDGRAEPAAACGPGNASASRSQQQQQNAGVKSSVSSMTSSVTSSDSSDTELWLCSGDSHTGTVTVLTYTGHSSRWEDILTMSCSVYSITAVRDVMWLGMRDGSIMFVDAATRTLVAREWLCRDSPVLCMLHVPEYARVFVALGNGVVIAYDDRPTFTSSAPESPVPSLAGGRHGVHRSSTKSAVGSVYTWQERLKDQKPRKDVDSSPDGSSLSCSLTNTVSPTSATPPAFPMDDAASRLSAMSSATLTPVTAADSGPTDAPMHVVELDELARYTSRSDTIACMIAVPMLHEEDDPLLDDVGIPGDHGRQSFSSAIRTRTPTGLRSPMAKSGAVPTCTSPIEASARELEESVAVGGGGTPEPRPPHANGGSAAETLRHDTTDPHEASQGSDDATDGGHTNNAVTGNGGDGLVSRSQPENASTVGGEATPSAPMRESPVHVRETPTGGRRTQHHARRGIEIWCGHDHGRIAVLDAMTLRQRNEVGIPPAEKKKGHMAHLVVSNLSCSTVARVCNLQRSRRVDYKFASSEASPEMRRDSPGSPSAISRLRSTTVVDPRRMQRVAKNVRRRCTVVENSVVVGKRSGSAAATARPAAGDGSESPSQQGAGDVLRAPSRSSQSSQDEDAHSNSQCSSPSSESLRSHQSQSGNGDTASIAAESQVQLVQTVWGSVRHSPLVYCWDVRSLQVVTRVDCSSILKMSGRNEGAAYVSSLLCHEQELYIGTRGGHIIIMDLSREISQPPFHAFYRHHQERVSMFLPVLQHCCRVARQQAGGSSKQATGDTASTTTAGGSSSSSSTAGASSGEEPVTRQRLIASCGGGFRGYIEDEEIQHAAIDHDGHVLMWETEWMRPTAEAPSDGTATL